MPIDVDRLRNALADRYAIDREIGRGGMATVFLAEDLKHGRRVAVKVLEPELASSLGSDRFLREIETAARLNHPHIVGLIESGDADGFLYYVMPYMAGDSLRDRLDRERELPVDEAVQIAREVASGLDHAHEQGIVHRDIKPGNIMLSGGHAVVADFGIARAVDEAGGERVTKTGISLGSPIYMSPEQAAGSETVDGRTDIYALGCVVYEMLAGEPPYSGKSTASIVARKQLETAPRLGELRETVPAGVEDAVARVLARSPADRFASAGEFADALEAPSEPRQRQRQRSSIARTVIAAAFVIAIAATGWLLGPGSRVTPAEASDLRSIAVLPFENRGTEEGSELFAEGMHEDILAQLSKIDSLTVISSGSVLSYAGTDKTAAQIAEELGVATILDGNVQQAGGRVRINVQLVDAKADRQLWAETYNRELSTANIFAIQEDVAKAVAGALRATLSPGVEARIASRPTEDLDAYNLVVQARHVARGSEREGFETAVDLLRQAIERDSSYALAWAGLSRAYSMQAAWNYIPRDSVVPLARAAANRALELDDELAWAHAAKGFIHYWFESDFETAERYFRRALELDPNSSAVLGAYAGMLRFTGRPEEALAALGRRAQLNPLALHASLSELLLQLSQFDESLEEAERLIRLDPDYAPAHAMRAFALMALGRFDEAVEPAQRALDLNPDTGWATALGWLRYWERDWESALQVALDMIEVEPENRDAYFLQGSVYAAQGRYAEAIAPFQRVVAKVPNDPYKPLLLAYVYARSGREDRAREILASIAALEDDPRWPNSHADAALVYGALGENDRAFELLNMAVEARARGVEYLMIGLWWLEVEPRADPLRDDPRWEPLMRRVGPPE